MTLKEKIIENVNSIPSMSSTVLKLGQIIRDPDSCMEDIVNILKLDTGLTADVLRLANSAAFGLPRQVSSVKEAIVRLGMKKLYQLAISSSVRPIVNKSLGGYFLDEGEMWRHSIAVAIVAENIAKKSKKTCGDIFTAGMLHDVVR